MLSQLLVYAPRDHKGRPEFGHWRRIPGLYNPPAKTGGKKNALTLYELRTRRYSVVAEDFPGLLQLLDELGDKICEDSYRDFPSLRAAAQALGIAPSTLSDRLRKFAFRKKENYETD